MDGYDDTYQGFEGNQLYHHPEWWVLAMVYIGFLLASLSEMLMNRLRN